MGKRIGVLALQGSVAEHRDALARLPGVTPVAVREARDLKRLDGLILPGGESTTIALLLRIFEMDGAIKRRIAAGMPAWGTCAGMILLAREIVGETPHIPCMDMRVRRNAYGRQLGSFRTTLPIPALTPEPVPCVFIRAPWADRVWGDAEALAEVGGRIVAVRQGSLLATSFHPELTADSAVHAAFAAMC